MQKFINPHVKMAIGVKATEEREEGPTLEELCEQDADIKGKNDYYHEKYGDPL